MIKPCIKAIIKNNPYFRCDYQSQYIILLKLLYSFIFVMPPDIKNPVKKKTKEHPDVQL